MFTKEFIEQVALNAEGIKKARPWGRYLHHVNYSLIRSFVPTNAKVLAIGPWVADLLAGIEPQMGVAVDPYLSLYETKPDPRITAVSTYEDLADSRETFDYIVVSFSFGFMEDILESLLDLRRYCHSRTRIIITYYRRSWQPFIKLAERLGVKSKSTEMNWVPPREIENLLQLANFQIIKDFAFCLAPLRIPLLSNFVNKFVANLPLIRAMGLMSMIVARPIGLPGNEPQRPPKLSIIVPARNESGNIPLIVKRIPEFPGGSEIIFVEGNSSDGTRQVISQVIADNPNLNIKLLVQDGRGKKNAVLKGFAAATGDILAILDADMTVPPETLPRFVKVLVEGKAEFINGSRLVYPMRGQAMRLMNLLGNIFFGKAFSYLLDQPVRDTLCGTKVMLRRDYVRMADRIRKFGNWDPFGDFDLLFGASCLDLKIVDLPVRYEERTYGDTNINRWRDGFALLKITVIGLVLIKFGWLPIYSGKLNGKR